MCAHREDAYRALPARAPLAVSEACQDHGLLLPLYPGMTADEQDAVVVALHDSLALAAEPQAEAA
jgi:dTDP-4-amino-4,6-dideoxygalactose transaminase